MKREQPKKFRINNLPLVLGLLILTPFTVVSHPLWAQSGTENCGKEKGLDPETLLAISQKVKELNKEEAAQILTLLLQSKEKNNPQQISLAQQKMGMDDSNMAYFMGLLERRKNPVKADSMTIFEEGKNAESGRLVAFPTAIAPLELMKELPAVDYAKDILGNLQKYSQAAQEVVLWFKPMQAGTGSSVTRKKYLSQILGIPEENIKVGAKGTDLFVEVEDPHHSGKKVLISLAEAQILRILKDGEKGDFHQLIFHDVISSETDQSIKEIWKKPSLVNPEKTYEELIKSHSKVHHFSLQSYQYHLPTINLNNEVSFNRTAPGGHGLFGVDSLVAAIKDEARPSTSQPLIGVIGNGEDLSAIPDAAMVGWIHTHEAPIVMVTTEKTNIDLKGGQIALIKGEKEGQPFVYTSIIEKAQADEAKQGKLFETIGLRPGDKMAYFNTNMALFNYKVLVPKIKKLVEEIGEREFINIIAPNLIENGKEQVDKDGIKRKYTQLEGALGSVLLNLDKYWRAKYNEPLVHIINIDKNHRTSFFSPLKTAFDFFMQFHSDRFSLDKETFRLKNHRPGELPAVLFSNPYYSDVTNVMTAFQGTAIMNLDSLAIDGKVKMAGLVLKGKVAVNSKSSDLVDLTQDLEVWKAVKVLKGQSAEETKTLENITLTQQEGGQWVATDLN